MNWSPTRVTPGRRRSAIETVLSPTRVICSMLTRSWTTAASMRSRRCRPPPTAGGRRPRCPPATVGSAGAFRRGLLPEKQHRPSASRQPVAQTRAAHTAPRRAVESCSSAASPGSGCEPEWGTSAFDGPQAEGPGRGPVVTVLHGAEAGGVRRRAWSPLPLHDCRRGEVGAGHQHLGVHVCRVDDRRSCRC